MILSGKRARVLIYNSEIQEKVREAAAILTEEYRTKEDLIFLVILKGSLMFATDLIKQYKGNCKIETYRVRTYNGAVLEHIGEISMEEGLKETLLGQNVIVVEDIVDSGNTIMRVNRMLNDLGCDVRNISLLYKPDSYNQYWRVPRFAALFEISDEFVVGYGMDLDELHRSLPHIYQLRD